MERVSSLGHPLSMLVIYETPLLAKRTINIQASGQPLFPPTVVSEHRLHYMISQRAVQVSQKIISRRCFNPQCLGGEGLSGIARKLLGSVITSHSDARLSSSSTRWKTR